MHHAENYQQLVAHTLVGSARQGVHTIPQELRIDYDALLILLEEGKDARGYWLNAAAENAAERQALKLHRLGNYGGRAGLIKDHIAPAQDAYLEKFTQARRTAGAYAHADALQTGMLLEPQDVREAITVLYQATHYYEGIRRAWALLRGGLHGIAAATTNTDVDPRGALSPLGEVRNINDLEPEWVNAGSLGGKAWPWGDRAPTHIRLGWLIDHGAQFWAPSAAEHNQLYVEMRDAQVIRTGPVRAVASTHHAVG